MAVGGPIELRQEIVRLLKVSGWPSYEATKKLWEAAMDVVLERRLQSGREDE